MMYSDNSGEINASCRLLWIPRKPSLKGVPQSNSLAERIVQDALEGTPVSLLQAGLPTGFWPYAGRHYCFLDNIDCRKGESAWLVCKPMGLVEANINWKPSSYKI